MRIALLVALAVLGFALPPAAQAADPPTWDLTAPCPDVIVYGARGSGQPPGLGPEVSGFAERLHDALERAGRSAAVLANPYPAVDVGDVLAGEAGFFQSIDDGVRNTKLMAAYVRQTCGTETALVLAGYSQGAMAIREGASAIEEDDRPVVGALVTIADPMFDPASGGLVVGSADLDKGGMLGRAAPAEYVAAHTVHVCDASDVVCQSEELIDLVPNGFTELLGAVHRGRYQELEPQLVAAFLTTRLLLPCRGRTPTVLGTAGPDTLEGTAGPDVISGLGGDDVISGLDGSDVICGDAGEDSIDGGGGSDLVVGGADADTLTGTDFEADQVEGGPGDDVLATPGGSYLDGGEGDDDLRGGVYADGGPGADVLVARGSTTYLDGGEGDDRLAADEEPLYLDAGDGADVLEGGTGVDYLDGGAGDDELRGHGGDDYLDGGAGLDLLDGGPDADYFAGGEGDDVLAAEDLGRDRFFECGDGLDELRSDPTADADVGRSGCERDLAAWLQPPRALSRPLVVGRAVVGQELTALAGTWSGAPTAQDVVWQRCSTPSACVNVGAGETYVVGHGDGGQQLRLLVTATNPSGSASATSPRVGPVFARKPSVVERPEIFGTGRPGRELVATLGQWTGAPTGHEVRWERCVVGGTACSPIPGAGGETYVVTHADTGQRLRVVVTASSPAGSASTTSPRFGPVTARRPVVGARPSITGTPRVGVALTASPGTWSDAPTEIDVRWDRCSSTTGCVPIPGADEATYTPTTLDRGKRLRVVVVARNPMGTGQAATSPGVGPVAG